VALARRPEIAPPAIGGFDAIRRLGPGNLIPAFDAVPQKAGKR
jgi:hypothetical protein